MFVLVFVFHALQIPKCRCVVFVSRFLPFFVGYIRVGFSRLTCISCRANLSTCESAKKLFIPVIFGLLISNRGFSADQCDNNKFDQFINIYKIVFGMFCFLLSWRCTNLYCLFLWFLHIPYKFELMRFAIVILHSLFTRFYFAFTQPLVYVHFLVISIFSISFSLWLILTAYKCL